MIGYIVTFILGSLLGALLIAFILSLFLVNGTYRELDAEEDNEPGNDNSKSD